jgi:hypothetical protein
VLDSSDTATFFFDPDWPQVMILLSPPPNSWDYRHKPLHPAVWLLKELQLVSFFGSNIPEMEEIHNRIAGKSE